MLKVSFNDTALIWLDKSRSWHHLGFTALRKLLIIASVYVCVCVAVLFMFCLCVTVLFLLYICVFYLVCSKEFAHTSEHSGDAQ